MVLCPSKYELTVDGTTVIISHFLTLPGETTVFKLLYQVPSNYVRTSPFFKSLRSHCFDYKVLIYVPFLNIYKIPREVRLDKNLQSDSLKLVPS